MFTKIFSYEFTSWLKKPSFYLYLIVFSGISFLAFTITIKAQEKTMTLSLEEAIDFALENSYNTKAAKNDVLAAKKVKWETTTIGLPQVNAKIDYQNFLKQPVSLLPAGAFDNRTSVVQTVEDFFGLTRDSSPPSADGFIPVVFGTKQNVNAAVTLTQLLFDGSYLVGLQSAKTYLQISEQAKEKTALATREAVINAYGNVLVAEKSIEILLRNKKVNDRILKEAKVGYENGLAEQEDVEQFEIIEGNILNNIRAAKRLKSIAYKLLNLSLGNDINTKLTLTDSLDSLVLANTDLNLLSQEFNIDNHIDFKIAENDRESKRLLMKLEQSKALPSLSAFLNYGSQGFSDSFSFFNSNQQWFDSSLLGVSLNIPIFSSFKRSARTAQAKIALETADLRLVEAKQRLSLAAENAKINYQLSIEHRPRCQSYQPYL